MQKYKKKRRKRKNNNVENTKANAQTQPQSRLMESRAAVTTQWAKENANERVRESEGSPQRCTSALSHTYTHTHAHISVAMLPLGFLHFQNLHLYACVAAANA